MVLCKHYYVQLSLTSSLVFSVAILFLLTNVDAEESHKSEFNFVAAGDWGCGDNAQKTLAMMKSMNPELYLGLGDYSYSLSADCRLNIIKPVSDSFKIAIGNHDTLQRKLDVYIDKFGLANQYYSFDYFNTHFISLSTELEDDKQVRQFTFVRNDLLKTKSNEGIDWIIVFFHKPFYSGKFDITNMRDDYHPLFEEFGVDLVIQGHSHNYQRTYPLLFNEANPSQPIVSEKEQIWYRDPKGIIFVVAGTGGESIQTLNKKSILASSYEGYGCINVEVNGKSLSAEYYSDTSDTIDRFLITKEPHDSNNIGER